MDIDEARSSIGAKVVYRAPHIHNYEPGEEGVITSVNESYVFVRYGADTGSRATRADQLVRVAPSAQPYGPPDPEWDRLRGHKPPTG